MTHPILHPPYSRPARSSRGARTHPAAATTASALRAGFTLTELLIASVVLAVGLLALTTAGAAVVRLESRGRRLARTAAAAESRLESLRALGCVAASGAGTTDGLAERWSVRQVSVRTVLLSDSVVHRDAAGPAPGVGYIFRSALHC